MDTALRILNEWMLPDVTPDALRHALAGATAAATRPNLNTRSKPARLLRERTSELLFDNLRLGRDWARELLTKLADSSSTPRALRKEITERLQQAAQIEKAHNQT